MLIAGMFLSLNLVARTGCGWVAARRVVYVVNDIGDRWIRASDNLFSWRWKAARVIIHQTPMFPLVFGHSLLLDTSCNSCEHFHSKLSYNILYFVLHWPSNHLSLCWCVLSSFCGLYIKCRNKANSKRWACLKRKRLLESRWQRLNKNK